MPEIVDLTLEPSGCDDFDEARRLLADQRLDEALDHFELAADATNDPEVRASAAAFAAGILLTQGRPFEVSSWCERRRLDAGADDLADLLEASAAIQLEDVGRALHLLDRTSEPRDPYFPASRTVARVVRGHALWLAERHEEATDEVLGALVDDPFDPGAWDAVARLCADAGFDPAPVLDRVPDDAVFGVCAALRDSTPEGVDVIAQMLWDRNPGDPRVLALATAFAERLDSLRALEWAARLRLQGIARCPLLARAERDDVPTRERVRAAMIAHATFGDDAARPALERAVAELDDDDVVPVFDEVIAVIPDLADSVIVGAATTVKRSLRLAVALRRLAAVDEAYAVLVHGLGLEDAEQLQAHEFAELLPSPLIEELAEDARARGDDEVAAILCSVAARAEPPGGGPTPS